MPQRLQLAGALLASAVVIVTAYQGRLFTLIQEPERHSEIDTFDQLADSGLPIAGQWNKHFEEIRKPDSKKYYSSRDFVERNRVSQLPFKNSTATEIQEYLARRQRFTWLINYREWNILSHGSPVAQRMRPMKATLGISYMFMHTRRNWPWLETLNQKILEFKDFGLVRKWEEDYMRMFSMYLRVRNTRWKEALGELVATDDGPRVLVLEDLWAHLQCLGAGLLMALVVVGVELCTAHRWIWKRKNKMERNVNFTLKRKKRIVYVKENKRRTLGIYWN